jgi:hypothetical protein
MTTTVYKFGIGRAPDGFSRKLLLDEMAEAHHMKNRLIQIERKRRQAIREVQNNHPVVGPLTRDLQEVNREIAATLHAVEEQYKEELDSADKREFRARKLVEESPTSEAREALREAHREHKALKDEVKKAQTKATKELRPQRSEINKKLKQAKETHEEDLVAQYNLIEEQAKEAKSRSDYPETQEQALASGFRMAHSAPFFGTKKAVHDTCRQSFGALVKNLDPDNDPNFRVTRPTYKPGSRQDGKVESGVNQVNQTGLLSSFNGDVRKNLRIKNPPAPEAYMESTPRGVRKRMQRTQVEIRIAKPLAKNKNVPGSETWIQLNDVIFHRQIKPNAIIKDASVKMETVGTRECWFLLLTISEPDVAQEVIKPKNVAAVLLNAQIASDGGSCASVADEEGGLYHITFESDPRLGLRRTRYFGPLKGKGEAISSTGIIRKDGFKVHTDGKSTVSIPEKIESVRAAQANNFNELMPIVIEYIKTSDTLPEALASVRDVFDRIKSCARMQNIFRQWKNQRVRGDEKAFRVMEAWAYQDWHLFQWHRNMEKRLENRRDDAFKKQAHLLCKTYNTILLDDRDLTADKQKKEGEIEKVGRNARRSKTILSPGKFRQILKNTAARMGTQIIEVPPAESAPAMLELFYSSSRAAE